MRFVGSIAFTGTVAFEAIVAFVWFVTFAGTTAAFMSEICGRTGLVQPSAVPAAMAPKQTRRDGKRSAMFPGSQIVARDFTYKRCHKLTRL